MNFSKARLTVNAIGYSVFRTTTAKLYKTYVVNAVFPRISFVSGHRVDNEPIITCQYGMTVEHDSRPIRKCPAIIYFNGIGSLRYFRTFSQRQTDCIEKQNRRFPFNSRICIRNPVFSL